MRATVQASDDPGDCTVIGLAAAAQHRDGRAVQRHRRARRGLTTTPTRAGPAHAGAVVVPALLATAERHGLSGRTSGRGIAVGPK
jgi:hypothetical protein